MGFLANGKKTEKRFSSLLNDPKFSSTEEDIHEHWDVSFDTKIDVKGIKYIKRQDDITDENYHWVELKNVRGKLGWLFGNSDYFAFETNRYWVIVGKEELQNLIQTYIHKDVYVDSPYKALYCYYQRNNRKDIITLVPTIDLMAIAENVITKEIGVLEYGVGESIIYNDRVEKKKADQQKSLNQLLKKSDQKKINKTIDISC